MKCHLADIDGAPLESTCLNCGHHVGSHLYPAAICMECVVDFLTESSIAVAVMPSSLPKPQLEVEGETQHQQQGRTQK